MDTIDKYNTEQEGLWFSFEAQREEHVAFISAKALDEHFDPAHRADSPHAAYKRHRKAIDSAARRKLMDGSPKPVLLRSADFGADDAAEKK